MILRIFLFVLVFHATLVCKSQTYKNDLCAGNSMESAYLYEDDSIKQVLYVEKIAKDTIEFLYCISNTITQENHSYTGLAHLITFFNSEIDEDRDGVSYGSLEFIYVSGECKMKFRFGIETGNRAHVMSYTPETCFIEDENLFNTQLALYRIKGKARFE